LRTGKQRDRNDERNEEMFFHFSGKLDDQIAPAARLASTQNVERGTRVRYRKMPDVDVESNPAFSSRCAAKTELCVIRVISLGSGFFRFQSLHGMSVWMIN